MGWLSGRGIDPDQAESLLRSLPNVDSMTPTDLQRVIDQMNAPAPRARMESPVSLEERVVGNPETGLRRDGRFREWFEEHDPEFAARMDSASAEEIMDRYGKQVWAADNVRRGAPRKSPARVMDTPVASVPPPQGPVRQMELPLGPGAPEPNIRELLGPSQRTPQTPQEQIASQFDAVTGNLGRDPFSAPRSPQPPRRPTAAMQPDDFTQRLADGRTQAWGGGDADEYVDWLTGQRVRRPGASPPPAADELIDGPSPGMRASQPEVPRPVDDGPKMPWGSLAGGLGLGLGLSQMMPEDAFKTPPASGATPKNSTTADLAEESRPAPKVEVTEETPQPSVKQGPPDYSAQARQLIARANDIQRQAGRQTPESIALINQANRLYEMAAEGRRNGSQPAIMPVEQQNQQTSSIQRNAQEQVAQNQGTDYRSQARRMMAELNIRSSQGNISSAEYSAMKRRIDELFALADREDNARRNPSDRRPNTGGGMGRAQLIGKPKRGPELIGPTPGYQKRRSPSTT